MELWGYTGDILGVLAAALIAGVAFERVRQSPVTGYMLVGMVLGPGGLGAIEIEVAETLSEIGVVLLLFLIGLEFSWNRLKAFGLLAALGGGLQVGLTLLLVGMAAVGMGRPFGEALILGSAVALSSTAVVIRILMDRSEMDSAYGRACTAILLFQDVAVVVLLLMVGSLEADARLPEIALKFLGAAAKTGILVVTLLMLTRSVLPRFFPQAAMHRSREHLVALSLLIALGSALGAHTLGLSPTLGAFLAGMMLGEGYFAHQMRADLISFQAFFLTLFFTSIGMVADFGWIAVHVFLVLAVLGAVLVIKAVVAFLVVFLFRHSAAIGMLAGLALANVGEFAFVLIKVALDQGVCAPDVFKLVVAVAVFSMALTPYLMAVAGRAAAWMGKAGPAELGTLPEGHRPTPVEHVIVVGFGPVGQKVVSALGECGIAVVVIDLNAALAGGRTVSNTTFLFGDACRREILLEAGILNARALVVTIPDPASSLLTIRQVRDMASVVPVVVRARYHIHVQAFQAAGAAVVVDEEETMGEETARRVMTLVGPYCRMQV